MKARRYLEIRWGEVLGPGEDVKTGRGRIASHASEALDKDSRHRFRQLAAHKEKLLPKIREATDVELLRRNSLFRIAHIAQNAGDNEWYTPAEYIEAARHVLGDIDLDPASTAEANSVVEARRFYTTEDDVFSEPWRGHVWMNPPYAHPLIEKFVDRLIDQFKSGDVTAAISLTNNATATQWCQKLAHRIATNRALPQ